MYFRGLGTATPPRRYAQVEGWLALQESGLLERLQPRSRAILKKALSGKNGISTRYLVLNPLTEAFQLTPDALHARFAKHAPVLAGEAARRALAEAGITAAEVDAVIISTCTGYLCPGLTSYVSEALGLRADVPAVDMVGQGCGAALPNLRTAENFIAAGRENVLSICVEVCSAAFYLDDDPGVLISACLFGDGAAAAVMSKTPNARRRVEWKGATSVLAAAQRDILKFETRGGMLRNVLGATVPETAGLKAREVFDSLAGAQGLTTKDFSNWIFHAGGRDVLAALQRNFGLAPEDFHWSTEVLEEHGNLSSPFVLFTLKRALENGAAGGRWWLASFGAGFSSHGAILEVA